MGNPACQPACSFTLSSLKHKQMCMQAYICLCFETDLYTKKSPAPHYWGTRLNLAVPPWFPDIPGTQLMRNVHIRHSLQEILQEWSSDGNFDRYLNLKRASSRWPTLSVGNISVYSSYTATLIMLQCIIFVFTAFYILMLSVRSMSQKHSTIL